MINKFFKTINNKYSRFFKFIFYLRYLFLIFFLSVVIFLNIPNFFNYSKKIENIKYYLLKNFNYEINNYEKIEYNIFPVPNLELKNVQINLQPSSVNLTSKYLKIYPNFLSIYNYENFKSNKIIFKNTIINLESKNLKFLANQLLHQKSKLYFDNLAINISDNDNHVVSLKNLKFANFGYNKNLVKGEIFGKNFKVNIDNDFKNINFKLLSSGLMPTLVLIKIKKKTLRQVFLS